MGTSFLATLQISFCEQNGDYNFDLEPYSFVQFPCPRVCLFLVLKFYLCLSTPTQSLQTTVFCDQTPPLHLITTVFFFSVPHVIPVDGTPPKPGLTPDPPPRLKVVGPAVRSGILPLTLVVLNSGSKRFFYFFSPT